MTKDVIENVDDLELDDLDIEESEVEELEDDLDIDDDIDLEDDLEDVSDKQIIDETILDDEDSDIDDIELEDEPDNHVENSNKPEIKRPVEQEIELDDFDELDDEPEITQPVKKSVKKEQPVKKVKKPRKKKSKTETVVYDPTFDISLITDDRYQIRKTLRTEQEIKTLADKIRLQGQIEPIQVLKKGKEYYPMAGFGRLEAIALNEMTTAKALIYENLTDKRIQQICTGSNEGRVELSEWDKIWSVGEYYFKNPTISVDDKDDGESLKSVFGYSASKIYKYIQIYNFFKDKEPFVELFKNLRTPIYVYLSVKDIMEKFQEYNIDDERICLYIKDTMKKDDINKTKFKNLFLTNLSDYVMELKTGKSTIDDLDDLDDKLDNSDLADAESDIKDKLENVKDNSENKKIVDEGIEVMINLLDSVTAEFKIITEIDDYKSLMNSKDVKKLVKKITELNEITTVII